MKINTSANAQFLTEHLMNELIDLLRFYLHDSSPVSSLRCHIRRQIGKEQQPRWYVPTQQEALKQLIGEQEAIKVLADTLESLWGQMIYEQIRL